MRAHSGALMAGGRASIRRRTIPLPAPALGPLLGLGSGRSRDVRMANNRLRFDGRGQRRREAERRGCAADELILSRRVDQPLVLDDRHNWRRPDRVRLRLGPTSLFLVASAELLDVPRRSGPGRGALGVREEAVIVDDIVEAGRERARSVAHLPHVINAIRPIAAHGPGIGRSGRNLVGCARRKRSGADILGSWTTRPLWSTCASTGNDWFRLQATTRPRRSLRVRAGRCTIW